MVEIPALNWIIGFIESRNIPYVICGGLAAKAYGSERELNDIDLYVPDEHLSAIVNFGMHCITHGPAHYVDEQMDLRFVRFCYLGQDVEVCSDKDCKFFDSVESKWCIQYIDFDNWELREIYGVELKVMSKSDLVSYKKQLGREVDLDDIQQICSGV